MPDDAQGSAATATGTGAADAANAGATGSAGATGTPAAFDWKTTGLDDGGMAFVTEKQWKSPVDTITSYRQLENAFGVPPERLIKLPAQRDAGDPKVWEPIWKQLGRPDTADKYVLPVPKGDKGEFATEVKPILHKIGATQSQATQLAEWWNGKLAAQQEANQKATEAKNVSEVTALKQSWGAEYDTKSELVDKAAETFGMTQDQLNGLKASMGPKAAMEFLYTIGSKLGVEDTKVPGFDNQGNTFGRMTPEMAQAKIDELSKPESGFAQLFESKDPKQRMEAHAEWNLLHQIAGQGREAPAPARRR